MHWCFILTQEVAVSFPRRLELTSRSIQLASLTIIRTQEVRGGERAADLQVSASG